MAETGCLKDGNFQNLQSSNILLGNKSLVAPLASQGKVIIDNITSLTGAGDGDVTLTATHMGSVYILSGQAGGNRKITLPALSDVNAGEQILFLITGTPHSSQITILTSSTDLFYGVVELSVAGNKATDYTDETYKGAGQIPASNLANTAHGIKLLTGDTACDSGSRFLFTCLGGTSYTAAEGGSGGTVATLTEGTTKVWLLEGNAVCDTTQPTGGSLVGAAA